MEKNEQEDFLAGLDKQDADPLAQSSDDLFAEEGDEVKTVEEKEVKPLPFYKDEKVQKYIEKQIEKRIKDFQPTAQQTFVKEVSESGDDKIVRALTRLVGDDTDEKRSVLNDLKSALDERDERASQRAYEKLQTIQSERQEQEQRELSEAEDELEEGRSNIESEKGIEVTDRQWDAYKQFLLKIEPKGGYVEYPDLVETWDVFTNYVKANRPSNAQAKVLASRGLERSSSSTAPASTFLKRDGKESLWQKLDKMI